MSEPNEFQLLTPEQMNKELPQSVVDALKGASTPPPKKCDIVDALGDTLNGLLYNAPTNPTVRAQCLNRLRQQIPSELVEYDKIKGWIETNITVLERAPQRSEDGIDLDATYSFDEYGSCNYSAYYRGRGSIPIGAEEIRQIVSDVIDAGGTLKSVVDHIKDSAKDTAEDHVQTDCSENNYDSHEREGSGAHEVLIHSDVHRLIIEWLESYDPDSLETLQSNE